MNRTADPSLEDFRRLPGLYRRWELTEICEPNRTYQIEDAGAHADGMPLLAIYVAEPAPDIREAACCASWNCTLVQMQDRFPAPPTEHQRGRSARDRK